MNLSHFSFWLEHGRKRYKGPLLDKGQIGCKKAKGKEEQEKLKAVLPNAIYACVFMYCILFLKRLSWFDQRVSFFASQCPGKHAKALN